MSGGKKTEKDWVVSDTDEQLLLFTPFMSMLKLHTIQVRLLSFLLSYGSNDTIMADRNPLPAQITSVKDEDDEIMRPKVLKLFTNRPHNLGFDDAEGETPTQLIELTEKDWNAERVVENNEDEFCSARFIL